jgi:GTP-binding protein
MDMAGVDGRDPVADYKAMRQELKAYREGVAEKPVILAANKMDLPASKKNLTRFRKETKTRPLALSAQTGEGIPELLEKIASQLKRIRK